MEFLLILAAIAVMIAWHVHPLYIVGAVAGIWYKKVEGRQGLLLLLAFLVHEYLAVGLFLGLWYRPFYYDRAECTGERRWEAFTRLRLWLAFKRWYRHRIRGSEAPPASVAIYGCHPHGILAMSAGLTFVVPPDEEERRWLPPTYRLAVHSILSSLPLFREIMLWGGCIDASEEAILEALSRQHSVALLPGGVREMGAPYHHRHHERPQGFLRIAYQKGCPAVPVYLRGERQICRVWHNEPRWLTRFRAWCARKHCCRFPFPTFFWPRWPGSLPPLETRIGRALYPAQYSSQEEFAAAYWKELGQIARHEEEEPPHSS